MGAWGCLQRKCSYTDDLCTRHDFSSQAFLFASAELLSQAAMIPHNQHLQIKAAKQIVALCSTEAVGSSKSESEEMRALERRGAPTAGNEKLLEPPPRRSREKQGPISPYC
eukprot:1145628-Pelagomonas_calceolata.AAC.1